tara:strand:+ start:3181 stop:3456 length:276 start_codon:yes stop_codon:yes gene_type:complete
MTFAEFSIREYAYKRQEQWSWAKFRFVGFMALRSFNIAPKSIPKSLKDLMVLPFVDGSDNNNKINEKQFEAFKAAQERYLKQVKMKQIGIR